MQQRRILIIANRVPFPLKDGGALAMDAMVKGYYDAGWQVLLLAMNTSRHYVDPAQLATLYPQIYAFETVDVNTDIKLWPTVRNWCFSNLPQHAERFYHKSFEQRIVEILQAFRPDVIQMESIYLSVYYPVIKVNSAALLVQRLHNVEYEVWQRLAAETSSSVKRYYLNNLARRLRRFELQVWDETDLLLPITEVDADHIKNAGCRTDILVAPYGLPENKHEQIPGSLLQGYHLGAMDWLPNAEAMDWFLDEIWPVIHDAVPDFSFSFAGRNMPQRFTENLPEGVTCAGEVADAAAFMAGKQILIVPLRSGGGIRVKIMEAMAAGRMVISTATGMQGIDAEPGVHYLLADTASAFAAQVFFCQQNPGKAAEIMHNGHTFIMERYGQKNIMNRLLAKLNTRFPVEP
ncbi:glycosyltransferase [Chitinophagaceae bacterium MMS25-I14]